MPLVICEDCGKEVSSLAPQCIHCGRPIQASTSPWEVAKDTAATTRHAEDSNRTAEPRKEERITKNYLWYLVVILVAAGFWISKGTPSPTLFFSGSAAKEACLKLANDNKNESFLFNDGEITADDTWLKDGKRVVRLLQQDGDGMNQIMCVYGNGMVQIPSLLEQGRWR